MNIVLVLNLVGLVLKTLPDLMKAISETLEALQASGSELPLEAKIQQATEAGQAWYRTADTQLNLSDEMDRVMLEQIIPALAALIFHAADALAKGLTP
jgi:hypothetical protein